MSTQTNIFDGSNVLELDPLVDHCMQYAMKAYDGPIGTLRSFFKEAFLRDKFLSLGIPLPAWWGIPADADEDPDIPASATQLQMMVYNATIAKPDKLRNVKVSYTVAELACDIYFKSLLGAAPLRLIALEIK